jgi:putative ABC transport system ATP-binding protein
MRRRGAGSPRTTVFRSAAWGRAADGQREVTIRDQERQAPNRPAGTAPEAALRFDRVSREFQVGSATVRALNEVSLEVPRGQFVAITGRSGSGKSTLLNLAAGIDAPGTGEVWLDGIALSKLGDDALTRLRRERVGVVYQFFNLLSTLTVFENVALPALLAGRPEPEVFARAESLIGDVGLAERRRSRPHMLSGGEMQRAAIARALIHRPALILADEPTGNLDSRAADTVVGLLRDLAARDGVTVVLVTHSREAAAAAERVVELADGRVVGDASQKR